MMHDLIIYLQEYNRTPLGKDSQSSKPEEECEVEDELQKELSLIKDKVKSKKFRFRQVNPGARSMIFVKIDTHYNPNELIDTIFKDVEETGNPKSRGIGKITPVLNTCYASIESIKMEFTKLAKEYLEKEAVLSYKVVFIIRNSSCVKQDDVVQEVNKIMYSLSEDHYFKRTDSDVILKFEVIKAVCCISILWNYERFRKYNIQEVARQRQRSLKQEAAKSIGAETVAVTEDVEPKEENKEESDTGDHNSDKDNDDSQSNPSDQTDEEEINSGAEASENVVKLVPYT